ncbi:carboxylate--amine ligase [Halorubellus sp. PRR65]|uniref:carboxylate--amine ligase n=1 Tax=Halorubellus sp. PRR65 TaxID=3098148 RepID=UPI002B25BE6A|nr:carboxylate--amine ligase [Halorubellus sp. PRR65]
MSTRFATTEELVADLEARSFERPPAIVCNAHVTGLGVARALAAHDVPVIALDRTPDGVAPGSTAVAAAGAVTYPLDDLDGFRADVEAVADAVAGEPVAFACMDEWVHALVAADPDGVRLPFATEAIDGVLDKTALYARCERLDVPYPETYRVEEAGVDGDGPPVRSADAAADALGFPLVVKPARKREFEEAVGTNVVEVADRQEFREVVDGAAEQGIRVMAQEKVAVAEGEDRSLASYRNPDGDVLGVVGNARVRHPRGFGTSCVVDVVDGPAVRERAEAVLDDADYHGISESEFVYDESREEYVLLDVNTRPWKWITLPVAAGANLPMAAYAATVDDATYEPGRSADAHDASDARDTRDPRWVFLADYVQEVAANGGDVLSREDWHAVAQGDVAPAALAGGDGSDLVAGVYRPDDPDPTYQLLRTELGLREYYCAC